MILLPDYNRQAIVDTIQDNPNEIVIGVVNDLAPHIQVEQLDDMVGKTFLVTVSNSNSNEYWKSRREVYRVDGYTVVQTGLCNGWATDYTLNKDGRFLDSRVIVDREQNGNHVYAYEREKIFKTLEDAKKVAKNGNWIRVHAVQCVYDERRNPHLSTDIVTPELKELK